MKKVTMKALVLIVTIIFSFTVVRAADDKKETKASSELVFLGTQNNSPLYHLNIKNDKYENYRVSIVDGLGNTLHTEKISGNNIRRNYRFSEDTNDSYSSITFIVENLATRKKEVYKTNKIQTVIEKVEVKKVL